MNRTFIIAEAGVNHNGSPEMAERMIEVAAEVGADAVKFQSFKADHIVSKYAPKAEHQKEERVKDRSQLEMLRELELDEKAHMDLLACSKAKGIHFISSPFDIESAEFLHRIGLPIFKIPSGEITNLPYLRVIGRFAKNVILSTGMANLGEIEAALGVITGSGTTIDKITILHCSTEYPTPLQDVNLSAMHTIKNAFPGAKVGYSDHTHGIEIAIAAVAMGATVIEKHFTLDRTLPGPDHKASIEPQELKSMVQAIRNVEIALGSGIKGPNPSEEKTKLAVRKSLIAAKAIRKGEILSADNVTVKRPGTGISPMRWNEVIGTPAQRNYSPDEII